MDERVVVSVICTCFNKGKWLAQALDSVMDQQTSFQFEVVIVDDASTDNSLQVIESYRQAYPDIVRVIAHEANAGISATWREACQAARGDYIARIDGDDYWTSVTKLEEQYQLLQASDDSDWCCTDFDMVDLDGNPICESVLEAGFIPTISSFEHMLAIKGLTNSSTWFVDANLMRAASESLRHTDADDTFTLQLEMFKATKLTRIPRSLCVMRVNAGSDSRPTTIEGARKRFEGLRDQQLEYLDKYPDSDFRLMARYLIEQDLCKDIDILTINQRAENLQIELDRQRRDMAELRDQLDSGRNAVRALAHIPLRTVKSIRGHLGKS